MSFSRFVSKYQLGVIAKKRSFKEYTTIRTGGKINCVYYPNSKENLIKAVKYIEKKRLKYFILGNGSNVVASDWKYRGIVISLKKILKEIRFEEGKVIVSAGHSISSFLSELAKKKQKNLEFLSGIPGTIGGAIYMNAGSFNQEVKDFLIYIDVIEKNGRVRRIYKEEIAFEYRKTSIKNIIINAAFNVVDTDENLDKIMEELRIKKHNIQPIEHPNCGSVFKNPPNQKAWDLLERVGLKGFAIGNAMFSPKHSNFIINTGNARSYDIYRLVKLAKRKVKKQTGYILEEEIVFINF